MKSATKRAIDTVLTISFAVVITTGIMLHLKKHGIVIEPRPTLKAIHYYTGFLMTILVAIHATEYARLLPVLFKAKKWFGCATWVLLAAFCATFITGTVKLLSPVKIPHLGLWHYWLGITMSLAAIVHLCTGLPWLIRKYRK